MDNTVIFTFNADIGSKIICYLSTKMTLILSLGNNNQMIQISDRRLSYDGKLVDDESNKCGVLFCKNARMAFGYTGLARLQNFNTQTWLLKALHDSAPPDYSMGGILKRLKINATNTFQNHVALKSAEKRFKRLSVMFSGYVNIEGGPPRQGCAILSNYLDAENNSSFSKALEEFSLYRTSAKKDEEWPTLVQRVGNWHAMLAEHVDVLRELVSQKKPAEAIIGKAIKIIREMADNPKSQGTIGKQLTSIAIPYDSALGVESNYYSDYTKPETYMPAIVSLLPDQHWTVSKVSIKPVEEDTPPLSVPKVGKNYPCPCGSEKKYQHCHGKVKKRDR